MNKYQFEIYTVNPETAEKGWKIKFRNVTAKSFERAKEILKSTPYFDCIILVEYRDVPHDGDVELVWDSLGGYRSDTDPRAPFLKFRA